VPFRTAARSENRRRLILPRNVVRTLPGSSLK
jgi:hypothetical protein